MNTISILKGSNMPVYQELLNLNEVFRNLKEVPVIINDISNISVTDKENIKEMITSRYSSDMISILPACQCGKTKGEFAITTNCVYCNTVVKMSVDEDIEPLIWFRRPEGVAPLINPIVWIMLTERFKLSGFNVVQWLADSTYRPAVKLVAAAKKIEAENFTRGYNTFYNEFDRYMEYLFSIKYFNKTPGSDHLQELLQLNRNIIFSDYIPLPNKSLLVIEKTNMGIYIDSIIVKAIDAIEMVASIDSNELEHSHRVKENRTIKAIVKLSEFYYAYMKENIGGKPGQFRKHVLGSRTNFNFRAVVSSLTEVHEYDEIFAPWSIGLTAFRPHLINKLLKRGYSLNSAIEMILGHVEKYSPFLDSLLEEIILESKDSRGIIVLENRNPTMLAGSIQTKRITKFKKDPGDHTVSTSILTVVAPNTDYDGDALNYSISLDNFLANGWKSLEPHHNVFVANTPLEISNNISIPKPVISSISNWIHGESIIDAEKLSKMNSLL